MYARDCCEMLNACKNRGDTGVVWKGYKEAKKNTTERMCIRLTMNLTLG